MTFSSSLRRLRSPMLAAAFALMTGLQASRADILISGSKMQVRAEIQNAALSEVIAQFASHYGFTFQSFVPLDRTINGKFSGSLRTVLSRLLEKNNYIARYNTHQLAITIYGLTKPPATDFTSPVAVQGQNEGSQKPGARLRRPPIANPPGVGDGGYIR